MKNLGLATKMSAVFAVLSLVSVIISVVSINRMGSLYHEVETAAKVGDKLTFLLNVDFDFMDIVRSEKNVIMEPSAANHASWAKIRDERRADMLEQIEGVKAIAIPEVRKLWEEFEQKNNAYYEEVKKLFAEAETYDVNQVLSKDQSPKIHEMRENFLKNVNASLVGIKPMRNEALKVLDDIRVNYKKQREDAKERAMAEYSQTRITIIASAIIGILAGLMLAFVILRAVTASIGEVMAGLVEGAGQVSAASEELSATSQQMAEGASEQAASIEETSSSLEEISGMTKQNADNSNTVNGLMQESKKSMDEGTAKMKELVSAMADIKNASNDIAKIIKVIEEIAFQTNLLALNAAVEAARAGEHGKGFAVVAEEVRNLAQRAGTASRDIAGLIQNAVSKADNGNAITEQVAKSMDAVSGGIKKAGDLTGEVAAASTEQAQGIEQINKAVTQMDSVTQQNAANAEEAASGSEELSAQSELMNTHVQHLAEIVFGAGHAASSTASPLAHRTVSRAAAKPRAVAHKAPVALAKPKRLPAPKPHAEEHHAPAPAPRSAGPKNVRAEEVIPFDDDFKEF